MNRSSYCVAVLLLQVVLMPTSLIAKNIIIKAKTPIYILPNEPAAVHRAVADLQRDLEKVFGQPSPVVDELPKSGIVIVVATSENYVGSQPPINGWEAHQVYADLDNVGKIVLNGADIRGTIYAIYTFSELFLGVKPLWFWASEQPQRKDSVQIASDFRKLISSPDVKYRAWFPNDRDLLNPWQAKSDENYEAFFETMLRLKLNTLEGGITDESSFKPPYPAGREATQARDRGLMVTGHHMLVFGSSFNNWDKYWETAKPQSVPALTLTDKQSLRKYWEFHINLAQRNNLDVIWLVGFRGNRDIPFWEFFPNSPTNDVERAKVIEEKVQIQIELLKVKTQKEKPLMRLTLYNEMSRLVANGLFKIPDEDSLIHNFVAARRDHFPAQDILSYSFNGELVGYYLNLQFTSSGSHLAQAEGPRKIEQNYRMVDSLSGGNLVFSVVNAGNIREHVLGLSANAEMMWNFKNFSTGTFLNEFSRMYFGDRYGDEIAVLYQDFFNSYWQQKKNDIPDFERQYLFQDMRYARSAEMIIKDLQDGIFRPNVLEGHPLDNPDKGSVGYFRVIPADNNEINQVDAILRGTSESIKKLVSITTIADDIYPQLQTGQHFFDDNLRGQAYLMLHLNRMLNYLTRAYKETANQHQRFHFIHQSLAELKLAQQRLRQSEHGRFVSWYASDVKFGMKEIENDLKNLIEKRN